MYSIAVVTEKYHVFENIKENLHEVLGENTTVTLYTFSKIAEQVLLKENIVLLLEYENLEIVRPYVADATHIIVAQRTFREKDLAPILAIPPHSDILVASVPKASVLEIIYLLSQIFKSTYNLIAYDESRQQGNIDYAITLGREQFHFENVKEIININNRCIDIYTFMRIFNKLGIDDDIIMSRLIIYSQKTVNIKGEIKNQYVNLFATSELLNSVVEKFNEGIVITDTQYKIVFSNARAKLILEIEDNKHNLSNLFDCKSIEKQKLVEIAGREILATKNRISHVGKSDDYFFCLTEPIYIRDLKSSLSKELRDKGLFARYHFENIIFQSTVMKNTVELAKKLAIPDFSILILGETGTGKELFAQAIHNYSLRKYKPFVAVNCAALPETLLESELFGYDKGAFTGANREGKIGLFEQADGGTLFLDEIGDMPVSLQSRLLRVLQEKQVVRLGSSKVIDVDVRIISATNQNPDERISKGHFRKDLYYRLNVFRIELPSLAQRSGDILYMLKVFTDGKSSLLSEQDKQLLTSYPWPGNVRELSNAASYINVMGE
ncbi:MAG: sigma 54-interacting transcriptional regulator, partial [Oscillospiraceae bacterium]